MNRLGVLDKHDIARSDRLREDIITTIREPGGLFFLSKRIYGFTRLNERIHLPPSMWLEKNIREPHALLSLCDPRGQGKSTLFTVSLPGWVFLQEDTPGTPIRGLNTRFGIVAPKRDLAAYGPVLTIRDMFVTNPMWKALTFDIIVPRKDVWSITHGLGIECDVVAGGPNIVAYGMESVATGTHPDIFIVDDPLNERNFNSLTEIAKIKDWIIKTINLTESRQGARLFIGNIWGLNDPQDWLRVTTEVDGKKIFSNLKKWLRGLEACSLCVGGRDDDHGEQDHVGEVFPVMLDVRPPLIDPITEAEAAPAQPATMEDVTRIQQSTDRVMLMAQYYNRPVAPGTLQFDMRDLKHWWWEQQGGGENEPVLLIPASLEAAKQARAHHSPMFRMDGPRAGGCSERILSSGLEIYILVDPAPSKEETAGHSRFAISVEGCERTGLRQFHLDEYANNAPPQKNLDAILDFYLKWSPLVRKIGVEAVAYQATIGDSLLDRARDRGIHTLKEHNIVMLPRLRSEGAQEDRIRYTLMPLFTGGNYYIHDNHRILKGEIATFGMAGAKHDLLDALSNLARVRGRVGSGRKGDSTSAAQAARKRLESAGPTGYGG